MQPRVLIIAGSDSSGGAGIQADLKTVMALGGYGMTAITALTAQNTEEVQGVLPVPPSFVIQQIEACLGDIGADAIKTGMLFDAEVIKAVAAALEKYGASLPLVIDPVMVAKGGEALLQENAVSILKQKLFPHALLVTPNIPEGEMLLARKIKNAGEMPDAARELGKLGSKAVLLKGGHLAGEEITDVLWDGANIHSWQSPRIISTSTHGTGCTLASAIATLLGGQRPLKDAVEQARAYVQGAIQNAPKLGHGHGPLNHAWKAN